MAKHWPGAIWPLRRMESDQHENGVVRTQSGGKIEIVINLRYMSHRPLRITMQRSTARLLARRIEQCLEATK